MRTSTPASLGRAVSRGDSVDDDRHRPMSTTVTVRAKARFGWPGPCIPQGMLHYVGRSVPGTLLLHTWREGLALFHLLLDRAPGADLVVMPDHVHLLTEREVAIANAMSAFARWRNRARRERGPVWEPSPPPRDVGDRKKQRRTIRYVYLNPCRARLVSDPLTWPLSTYRDAVGLAAPAVRERASDPERLHAYVSRDDTVATGSMLPFGRCTALTGIAGMRVVEAAVSEVVRLPFSALRIRGSARALFAASLRKLVDVPVVQIAAFVGVDARTIRRLKNSRSPDVHLVERLLFDPRFPGLPDDDLRSLPSWEAYAAVRRRRERSGRG
jgi:hypothetical protein